MRVFTLTIIQLHVNGSIHLMNQRATEIIIPQYNTMHERVTKHRRVLTLQVDDHCIINILLKDIQLKTKLRNHVFIKKFGSMGVFTLAIIQLHVNANIHLLNHAFTRYLPDRDSQCLSD